MPALSADRGRVYSSLLQSPSPSHLQNVDAWGTEVFGAPPEAVNLWLGDNQAVSSMHKVRLRLGCSQIGAMGGSQPSTLSYIPHTFFGFYQIG